MTLRSIGAFALAMLFIVSAARSDDAPAKAAASTYTDANYHFTINAPDLGAAAANVVPVTFAGPAQDGFAPNVNVMIQPVKTTRKEFMDITLAQFKAIDAKVNSQKELQVSGDDAEILDYEATFQKGRPLRFLALFVIAPDRVYLITCTATPQDFPAREAAFKKCLDTFKVDSK